MIMKMKRDAGIDTFGAAIRRRRKEVGMTQSDLAGRIFRDDGQFISKQYVHDIEIGRATPSAEPLLNQLAQELNIDADYLSYLAGVIPSDVRDLGLTQQDIVSAMSFFRSLKLKTLGTGRGLRTGS